MGGPASPDPRAPLPYDDRVDPRRWLYAGVVALLALVGVAIVLAVAVPLFRGHVPAGSLDTAPWNWVGGLIGLAIAILIVLWIVRMVAWGLGGPPYSRYYWRHYYRHRYPFGPDPAVDVARERFARGEITQDQLDQILRRLGREPAAVPL